MVRLLITGSRTWDDYNYILKTLTDFETNSPDKNIVLVSGECPDGADRLCEIAAKALGWEIELYPADWNQYGKRAGFLRNEQMVNTQPDVCIGFVRNRSKGGSMTVRLADKAGILTIAHYWDDTPAKVFSVKAFQKESPISMDKPEEEPTLF